MNRWACIIAMVAVLSVVGTSASAATADEPPMPQRGLVATGSTAGAGLYYADTLEPWRWWVGVHYDPGPIGIVPRVGVARTLIQLQRWRLVGVAVGYPSVLLRDELAVGVGTQVGIDSRWSGRRFGARVGVDIDSAVAVTRPHDRRIEPGLAVGAAVDVDVARLWITGRAGYTMAAGGSRALAYRLGAAVAFELN